MNWSRHECSKSLSSEIQTIQLCVVSTRFAGMLDEESFDARKICISFLRYTFFGLQCVTHRCTVTKYKKYTVDVIAR